MSSRLRFVCRQGNGKLWDYAAGALIVREAGGRVTDFNGNEDITDTHHVIASNRLIHSELEKVFTL